VDAVLAEAMRLLSEAPGMVDGDGDDLTTEAARIREEEDMTRAKLDVLGWNTSEGGYIY